MILKKLKNILAKSKRLALVPNEEWDSILNSQNSISWHTRFYVLPIMLLIAVSNFFGYFILALTVKNFSIGYAIVKTIAVIFESFFPYYMGSLMIESLAKKLKLNIELANIQLLLIYSSSIFWVAKILSGILANYPTLSSFIIFLGIYGIYIYMVGAEKLKLGSPKLMTRFSVLSAVIYILIYELIHWSFSFPLRALHYAFIFQQ